MENQAKSSDILVVGAGIAGITAALEAAETGYSVTLIEKRAFIGGRVAQLNQYFPKMCPPTQAARRLPVISRHNRSIP